MGEAIGQCPDYLAPQARTHSANASPTVWASLRGKPKA
jgi:hypothetical protein